MSTLFYKTLELNESLSKKLGYTKFILEFNFTSKRWKANKLATLSLLPFHFTWTLTCLILWPIVTWYVLIHKGLFNFNTIEMKYLCFAITTTPPMLLCNALNISFIRNSEGIVEYLNLLIKLQNKFFSKPN